MKVEVPTYIIKYIDCKQQGHLGEKINLICLNKQCQQHSLICSLCTPTHKGHTYKPLKIYLDQLYKKYRNNEPVTNNNLDQLQKRKHILLHHLRTCVQRISQEFMHLEEDILYTYQKIKNQIHENEARKSRFEEFYLSMIKDNYGDPHFQVKNYLFREQINIFTDQDIFQPLIRNLQKEIKAVRTHFLSDDHSQKKQIVPVPQNNIQNKIAYLIPPNITMEGENFTQSNIAINAPNLCLFDTQLSYWTAKLRVQITSFALGSKLTFGVIRKDEFNKANFIFKDTLNCMYVDSTGKSKSAQHNHLGALVANNTIDFFVKKSNFRIICKNNNSIINLIDKNYYFFFAMQGNCKIKITYPYNK